MTIQADMRVARGAALLDRLWPLWHWDIGLDRLDMRFTRRSIAGQLGEELDPEDYSPHPDLDFFKWLEDETGEAIDPAWCGFEEEPPRSLYSDLDASWRREIEKRREVDSSGEKQ